MDHPLPLLQDRFLFALVLLVILVLAIDLRFSTTICRKSTSIEDERVAKKQIQKQEVLPFPFSHQKMDYRTDQPIERIPSWLGMNIRMK